MPPADTTTCGREFHILADLAALLVYLFSVSVWITLDSGGATRASGHLFPLYINSHGLNGITGL